MLISLVLLLLTAMLALGGSPQITPHAQLPRDLRPRQIQGVAGYLKVGNECMLNRREDGGWAQVLKKIQIP